jgi:glutaredoxin
MVVLKGEIMRMFRRGRRRSSRPIEVILYERPGCHLCEDAELLLRHLAARYPLAVSKVDITTDAELVRRYDIRIPVIVVDGSVELEAPIDRRTLERALARSTI